MAASRSLSRRTTPPPKKIRLPRALRLGRREIICYMYRAHHHAAAGGVRRALRLFVQTDEHCERAGGFPFMHLGFNLLQSARGAHLWSARRSRPTFRGICGIPPSSSLGSARGERKITGRTSHSRSLSNNVSTWYEAMGLKKTAQRARYITPHDFNPSHFSLIDIILDTGSNGRESCRFHDHSLLAFCFVFVC